LYISRHSDEYQINKQKISGDGILQHYIFLDLVSRLVFKSDGIVWGNGFVPILRLKGGQTHSLSLSVGLNDSVFVSDRCSDTWSLRYTLVC
jgi:hypothetical protein